MLVIDTFDDREIADLAHLSHDEIHDVKL